MYQRARLIKLTQDLERDHAFLKSLRKEVTEMEAEVLQGRQNRNSAISVGMIHFYSLSRSYFPLFLGSGCSANERSQSSNAN
jgi:hypothetical protein